MKRSNISVKVDENIKNDFSNLCEGIGITVNMAIKIFIMQSIKKQGFEFKLVDKWDLIEEVKPTTEEIELINEGLKSLEEEAPTNADNFDWGV